MPLSDAQQKAWLRRQDVSRVVLVEMDYMHQVGVGTSATPTVGTLYFSNKGYVDNTIPREYVELITPDGHPKYQRGVDRTTLRGQVTSSVSSLVLNNADSGLDYLLTLAIDGSDLRVYVGDQSWAKSDFVHLFTAISVKVSAQITASDSTITVDLSDIQLLIDVNIGGDVAVGGTGPSADKFRPYIFGFVHQMAPITIDNQNFAFADNGTDTSVKAVRFNGAPLTPVTDYTDNADGTFTLAVPPTSGETITCDALRHASTSATDYRLKDAISAIVGDRCGLAALGKYYGPDATYFDSGTSPNPLNDYHIGMAIFDKTNVADWLDKACDTGNICYGSLRTGEFYFFRERPEAIPDIIGLSGGRLAVLRELTEDDYDLDSLKLDHNKPTFVGYQSYANVNQTIISAFSSSLSQSSINTLTRQGLYSAAFFGEETTTAYLGSTVPFRGGAPELYNKSLTDSQVVPTMISGPDDTSVIDVSTGWTVPSYQSAWSSIRRSQHLPWTEFIDGTVGLDCYDIELGNIVNLTLPYFELDGGELHQVVSIGIDPMSGIDLGLTRRRFAGVTGEVPPFDFLAQETGDLVLQEDGSSDIIVSTSGGTSVADSLLLDSGGHLLTQDFGRIDIL